MQAKLAEYNGNSHGPETLVCRPQERRHYKCLRVDKPEMQKDHKQEMQKEVKNGAEHPVHHGEDMHHGEHMGGMHSGQMRGTSAPTASLFARQAMPMAALPLSLGDACRPGFGTCPAGTECKSAPAEARYSLQMESWQTN